MRTSLIATALKNAAATTTIEPDAIWHSDRGSVYTSGDFRNLVSELKMRSSMGKTGICWDNAMAESFFSALKNERVYAGRVSNETAGTTRRQCVYRGLLQQLPAALSTRLPPTQRSPLQLSTASPGSIRKTIKTAVRNPRSSPDRPGKPS